MKEPLGLRDLVNAWGEKQGLPQTRIDAHYAIFVDLPVMPVGGYEDFLSKVRDNGYVLEFIH
jgi:hypothetical protein